MPWVRNGTYGRGLKGRESSVHRSGFSRPFRPRGRRGAVFPGHRPAASALGWNLPARWAGGRGVGLAGRGGSSA